MSTKEPKRPKIGLGVIICKDGKVLLGKRKNAHGEGTWCPPGGHLEFGETWEQCAARETLEEAGITLKNTHLGITTNDIFPEEQKHYVTLFMVSDYSSGDVKTMEPDKCEQWEWFTWDNLPSPLFIPVQNVVDSGFDPFLK